MNQLLSPICIGTMELKNRIVMAPTSMILSLEEKIDFLGRVADGGAALIYIGDMGVEYIPNMKSDINLFTPNGLEGCRRIVERLHQGGAKAGAQLYLWDYDMEQYFALAKSGATREEMSSFKNDHIEEYVTDMSLERVEEIIDHFAQAAKAAKDVGFDMVQVLGGHVISSFSSGYINHRKDAFGGSTEKRAALACEIVKAIRKEVGEDYPIEYKIPIHDDAVPCGQGGPELKELSVFVKQLEFAGVNAFQAAMGNRLNINDTVPPKSHADFKGEGCFLYISDVIKKYTNLPVSCAGKFSDPKKNQECIESGRLDYIGMSRQLVADPEWVNKVADGKEDDITRCIFCNRGCLGSLLSREKFHCVLWK